MKTITTRLALALALAGLAAGCTFGDPADSLSSEVGGRPAFDLFEGEDGRHYFRLEAANHEILLGSQAYSSRTGALGGLLSVLDNAGFRDRFRVREASGGGFYFNLVATNGQVIGTGEVYATRAGAERGVAATVRAVASYLEFQHLRTGARFDVFAGEDGRFYFNLHADNGEVVLRSQGYAAEASAYNGAMSVAANGVSPERYEVLEAKDGEFYFNVHARNGRVIATSEIYASRAGAERARDAVVALVSDVSVL